MSQNSLRSHAWLVACLSVVIMPLTGCSGARDKSSEGPGENANRDSSKGGAINAIKSTLFAVDKSTIQGEDRKLPAFSEIDASGRGNFVLTVKPGLAQLVRVEANNKSLKCITTKVENGVLRINLEAGANPEAMRIVVNTSDLKKLSLGGAFHAIVDLGKLNDHTMTLNGATNMTLNGQLQKLKLTINGASNVIARDLKCADCDVTISGASSADLDGRSAIKVTANGASHATLFTGGKPGKITQAASGAARVDINSETIY